MQTTLFRFLSFLTGALFGILAALVGMYVLTSVVQAATYQMFFNNVEQGPGGTASPSLQVGDGKAVKKASPDAPEVPLTSSAAAPAAAEGPAPASVTGTTVAKAPDAAIAPFSTRRSFRMLTGVSGWLDNRDRQSQDGWNGFQTTLTWFPMRDAGLSLYAGNVFTPRRRYLGAELELVPFRVGFFGLENLLEVGAMVGASNVGHDYGLWGSAHGGLRLTANFGDRIGLTLSARSNLSGRDTFQYAMADAGLSFRF